MTDNNLDIVAPNEARLQADLANAIRDQAALIGFNIQHVSDHRRQGTRSVVASPSSVDVMSHPLGNTLSPSSFEILLVRVTSVKPRLTLAVIWRPPGSNKSVCHEELSETVDEIIVATSDHLLLCGDINCPGEDDQSIDDAITQ